MALSTTWTERDVASFNAGILASLNDMRSRIQDKLKRGTLSASSTPSSTEANQEITFAKEKVCEHFGFTWARRYVYATTTANTYRYEMPDDYHGGAVVLRDITNDRSLDFIAPEQFDLKYPDPSEESSDKSDSFTIKDRELWVIPPSGGTYTLELEYPRSGADSDTTDVSYIPEIWRFKICDHALYRLFMSLHQWDAASLYKQEWMENFIGGRRENNRKKWSMVNQCLTWQQAYNARYNQWK